MVLRTGYVLFTVFVLVVLLGSGGGYYLLLRDTVKTDKSYDVLVRGSVAGVQVGTDVRFNGVDVGTVNRIAISEDDLNVVVLSIDISADVQITTTTVAKVSARGVTGLSGLEISGGREGSPLVPPRGFPGYKPIIGIGDNPADVLASVARAVEQAESAATSLKLFIEENETLVRSTLLATNRLMDNLSSSSESLPAIAGSLVSMANSFDRLSVTVNSAIDLAGGPGVLAEIIINLKDTTAGTKRVVENVADMSGQGGKLIDEAVSTLSRFGEVADSSISVINSISGEQLASTIKNMESFSKSLPGTSRKLDQAIATLGIAVGDAQAGLSKFDSLMSKLDSSIDGDQLKDAFQSLATSAVDVGSAAKKISGATNEIADSIVGTSTVTGRRVSEIALEARITLENINRLIDEIRDEPSTLIFGGNSRKQYLPER